MPIEVTCSCGRVLKAPDSAIGRRGRCKACGQAVEITAPADDKPEVEIDKKAIPNLGIVADEDDSEGVVPGLVFAMATPSRGELPPEPWYYGFLNGYAKLCLACGLIQFGVTLVLVAFLPVDNDPVAFPFFNRLVALGGSIVWLFGITLVTCPVFLAVDAARNLRSMRYGASQR